MQVDDLCACGIERSEAEVLYPEMEKALRLPGEEAWLQVARNVLKPGHPFALHQLLYRA